MKLHTTDWALLTWMIFVIALGIYTIFSIYRWMKKRNN